MVQQGLQKVGNSSFLAFIKLLFALPPFLVRSTELCASQARCWLNNWVKSVRVCVLARVVWTGVVWCAG